MGRTRPLRGCERNRYEADERHMPSLPRFTHILYQAPRRHGDLPERQVQAKVQSAKKVAFRYFSANPLGNTVLPSGFLFMHRIIYPAWCYTGCMSKLNVAVLRGGPSSEYDVSLKTGAAILEHMPERFQAHDILISKEGAWHREGFERSPDRALANIDVVFNAMHGEYGEDGKVQKILDALGMPYTGSGSVASSLAMNKHLTKKAFETHGIKTPYYAVIKKADSVDEKLSHIFHHFLLPLVVKPASSGSSVGVSVVKNFADLEAALFKAFAISDVVLVEEYIKGREATCGVVNNFRGEPVYALLPVEIIHPKENGFFDYAAKYGGASQEIVPGNFSEKEKDEIQRMAKLAHESLGLRHYSRSDFMIHPRRGVFILETNTLPGLTDQSLLPKSLDAIGCTMRDFIGHLLALAME